MRYKTTIIPSSCTSVDFAEINTKSKYIFHVKTRNANVHIPFSLWTFELVLIVLNCRCVSMRTTRFPAFSDDDVENFFKNVKILDDQNVKSCPYACVYIVVVQTNWRRVFSFSSRNRAQ